MSDTISITAILCFCIFGLQGTHETLVDQKLIDGNEAEFFSHPYLVELMIKGSMYFSYCGGVLIQPNVILTAASCLSLPNNTFVILGSHNTSEEDNAQYITEDYHIIHPDYNEISLANNLAIVVMRSSAELNECVQLIDLVTEDIDLAGKEAIVTGYGQTREGPVDVSDVANVLNSIVVDNQKCFEVSGDISDATICLSEKFGTACGADIGSPVVIDGVLAGIVNHNLCVAGNPTPAIKISKYLDFIHQNLKKINSL